MHVFIDALASVRRPCGLLVNYSASISVRLYGHHFNLINVLCEVPTPRQAWVLGAMCCVSWGANAPLASSLFHSLDLGMFCL